MSAETETLRQVCDDTIFFLRSLTGRDLPAYLVTHAQTNAERLELQLALIGEKETPAPGPLYIASDHLAAEFRRLEIFGFQASGLALAAESTAGLGNNLASELIGFRKVIEGRGP